MNVYLAGVITNAVRAARPLQPGAAGRGQPVAAHAFPPDSPTLAGAAARSGAPAQAGAAARPGARGEEKPALRQAGGGDARLAPTRPSQGGGGSSPPSVASAAASADTGFARRRVCIECMAGSARLTAALEREGMSAFGIDHKGNRHRPEGRVVIIDLSSPHGQKQVLELIAPGSDVVFV
eukprot:11430979-Heterocapsa_arctica.AAC.1